MNRNALIILIVLLAIISFILGMLLSGEWIGNSNSRFAQDVITSPVVTFLTLEGKVVNVEKDKMVIEKDGKRIDVYFERDSVFAKMPKDGSSQLPPTTTPLTQIPVGSELDGGGKIKLDSSTKQYRIYSSNFWVK